MRVSKGEARTSAASFETPRYAWLLRMRVWF
jgi:hypothetical protein